MGFTSEQFHQVFRDYNEAVWPAGWIAYAVGITAVIAAARRPRWALVLLALMWAWNGVAYHWNFFSPINPAARMFALAFVLQALLLLFLPSVPSAELGARRAMGWAAVVLAGAIYPLAGIALGHRYPDAPVFGIAPCPTTMFTFGVLLLAGARASLFIIPTLWSLLALSAALNFGMWEDLALPVVALAAWVVLWMSTAKIEASGLGPRRARARGDFRPEA